MAVQDRFQGGARLNQIPTLVSGMQAFFDERARMNDAALADQQGEDPLKLAKLEGDARKRIAEMVREIERTSRQSSNDASDLAVEALRSATKLDVAGAEIRQRENEVRLKLTESLIELSSAEADAIKKESKIKDEDVNILNGIASARNLPAETRYNQFMALANSNNAGGPGTVAYDALAMEFQKQLINAGVENIGEVSRMINPEIGDATLTDFYFKRHNPRTYEDQVELAEDISRANRRSGISGETTFKRLEQMGAIPAEIAVGAGSGGSSESYSTSGSPVAGKAYTSGIEAGKTPRQSMEDALRAEIAYVDDLAERRKAASANRVGRYPRANRYLANPNTYTPPVTEKVNESALRWDPVRRDSVQAVDADLARDWSARREREPEQSFDVKAKAVNPPSGAGTRFATGPRQIGKIEAALDGSYPSTKDSGANADFDDVDNFAPAPAAGADWGDIDAFGVEPAIKVKK
jgi:hypothetical protein